MYMEKKQAVRLKPSHGYQQINESQAALLDYIFIGI